jgi:hypothetical protein
LKATSLRNTDPTIRGCLDNETLLGQVFAEQIRKLDIIIDQKHVGHVIAPVNSMGAA